MPIRIRIRSESSASSNPSEHNDLGNLKLDIIDDTQYEGGVWKTVLIAGATNVLLNMGNLASANFIFLKTNVKDPTLGPPGNIIITKNSSGGEPTTIAPLGQCPEGHWMVTTSGITSLYASNPGSVDMEVTVMAAGA